MKTTKNDFLMLIFKVKFFFITLYLKIATFHSDEVFKNRPLHQNKAVSADFSAHNHYFSCHKQNISIRKVVTKAHIGAR
jgi:hypothetical protein